jgi:hypothetical protein
MIETFNLEVLLPEQSATKRYVLEGAQAIGELIKAIVSGDVPAEVQQGVASK